MKQLTKLSVAIGLVILATNSYAATSVADARSNGMGNTGVSTADYLLAPFHNPALAAVYRDNDSFGILLPAVAGNVRDTDKTIDTIDDLQDTITKYEANSSDTSTIDELNTHLNTLSGNKPIVASGGVGAAVAIPLNALSMNIFVRGYAEILALPEIAPESAGIPTRYETSTVDMVAFGYSEIGVALAKRFSFNGQDFALGITPKFQDMTTYKQVISVEDFDIGDYDQSETSKSAFNLDLGAVWLYNHFRAAIAVKDLISQEIDTVVAVNGSTQYKLDTQVTVSGAYAMEYFVATMDWDLTDQSRFSGYNDDTQFLRFGVEGNAFGWAQLRAGYQVDLEDTLDDSVTAGIGISPGDLVSLDFAGNYAGDNQYGLSANLAFTF
ncbi:conjugal transfer protein TraF [Vibrio genomosp. F10 str. 9ZC157]|uniref:Conjugal transfer protein TraF n=1 Tax=Vibrio genomosp. F10 str. ZF-129 TaxID=1187848 RepID=A0A1E5BB38_9VIBR|nr:conjugal transfer protein TraF [Vibrio genomosp. F10]OEE31298.1 conjugal transfer protein TraF [Vibrio genomosp. F10 str. ZF-129]OEE96535.1 conjugal transfer protein TraF [Vibrio genomosp. F10 str. 9ZC157]